MKEDGVENKADEKMRERDLGLKESERSVSLLL